MIKENELQKIPYAFQPIFDTSVVNAPTIYGYEALIRPEGKTPGEYISKMIENNCVHQLELETFYNAITQFIQRGYEGKLFINSFPYEWLSSDEIDFLESLVKERKKDIVIENLEYGEEINVIKLTQKLALFRDRHYLVALDDFGTGINSVELLKLFKPDITKIDARFIIGCTRSKMSKNIVEIIVEAIRQSGSKVLAEGVETKAEYDFLQSLHVDYMQGFYLGFPE